MLKRSYETYSKRHRMRLKCVIKNGKKVPRIEPAVEHNDPEIQVENVDRNCGEDEREAYYDASDATGNV